MDPPACQTSGSRNYNRRKEQLIKLLLKHLLVDPIHPIIQQPLKAQWIRKEGLIVLTGGYGPLSFGLFGEDEQ